MGQIADSDLMSQAEFARRMAVHPVEVNRAIKAGRLAKSLATNSKGVVQIADPLLAAKEWKDNADYTDAPARSPGIREIESPPIELEADGAPTLANAAARAKHYEAELKKLKYLEAAGELLPAKDVERRLVDVFTQCKTRLLAIPSRARQALPHLTAGDVLAIEELVREALEDLAQGSP